MLTISGTGDNLCDYGCGTEMKEPLTGSIRLRSAALNLQDKVCIVYYCSDSSIETNNAYVAERSVLLYKSAELAATKDPSLAYEKIELEWDATQQRFIGQSEGIDARDMDKSQFAVAYMKMTDGTEIFGTKSSGADQVIEYSPLIYCRNMQNDATVGKLCRALMQYGAAAQVVQYGMTTGLMNEGFEAIAYDESVLGTTVFSADTQAPNGLKLRSAAMDLQGAISYIVEFSVEDTNLNGKTMYAEYSLLGENGVVELGASPLNPTTRLAATISGVPAKDLGATLRVKAYHIGENGEKLYSGELVYSGLEYVRRGLNSAKFTEADKELCRAMAMYIYYADAYGN